MNEKRPPEPGKADGTTPAQVPQETRRPNKVMIFSLDEEAQRQVREEKARYGIVDQVPKPLDQDALDREIFKTRSIKLPSEVAMAEGHYRNSAETLDKLSSWEGYMSIMHARTMFPGQAGPSEQDRADKYAQAQRVFLHAADDWAGKQHALQTFQWFAKHPNPLKAALEALESQMQQETARAAAAKEALTQLEAIKGLPADSPKLLEARQEVDRLASMLRRYDSALRAARGQI